MIHVFHGFLGSPEDFQFIKREDVLIHDLYEMNSFPVVSPKDTLIGYSLGGRIALDIADSLQYQIKKIILINSHPGLQSPEEKPDREKFEEKVLQELQSKTREEFLSWWNALPIFKSDLPISVSEERYQKSAELFGRYRLSRQKNHIPKLTENLDKVLWIVGLSDEKYMNLVGDILLPHDIPVKGIEGGHRLFQQKENLKTVLMEEGIL